MKIAVAGFMHETNTFSPYPADLAAFNRPATLPGMTRGADIFTRFADLNIPVTGAMETLRAAGHTVIPICWASAVPSGPVTREAFETIAGLILDGLTSDLDGLYLDLHGAMVTEEHEDGEGELLRRIRELRGADFPIVASFDLHANLSEACVRSLHALTIFETYPHLDMANTGARAADILISVLRKHYVPHVAIRKLPYLIPLHIQCTDTEPAAALYRATRLVREDPSILAAEIALGFPPADVCDCGPAVVVAAASAAKAEEAVERLEKIMLEAEPQFAAPLYTAAGAVREARRIFAGRPVVIADTQDNPGAGGAGDTTGLLRALIEGGAQDAVVAILHDPDAARLAHRKGEGWVGRFDIGAHSKTIDERPVALDFTVEKLADGVITATGPMYCGNVWNIGATALLRHCGVRVIVSERRLQAADSSVLRHVDLDPAQLQIIALKSTVHFRADYQQIAGAMLVAASPGLHRADNRDNPYMRLRTGVRRMPTLD